MQMRIASVIAMCGVMLAGVSAHAQQATSTSSADKQCPMMSAHNQMTARGDQAMGFSAAKTTHHFRLYTDGGAIEVVANDPNDAESRNQIRSHLSHIAQMFADGNFNTPMLIHDTTPPGVPTMTKLRADIHYEYEETTTGGRVRIVTENAQAIDAIHAFLLFQIIEHQTGDSASVEQAPKN